MMDVRLEGLSVHAGDRALVERLTLDVAPSEIVGLVGPNGSGKSTALRCVYRALAPDDGVVRVGGDELSRLPMRESARRVAALTQEGGSDLDFTVEETVALGRTPHTRGNGPLTDDERALCRDAMARMDVGHLAQRGILSLSGGERQRVLIARALVQQPKVLILDEPTNHLDIRHQIELLRDLRGSGLTILIVLHDLNLAAATCDRLAVLAEGRLVTVGPPAEVLTPELMAAVFGIQATVVRHPLTHAPQILFTLDPGPRAGEPSPTPSATTKGRLE
jgi:iron complex transport system ATP-binding protein